MLNFMIKVRCYVDRTILLSQYYCPCSNCLNGMSHGLRICREINFIMMSINNCFSLLFKVKVILKVKVNFYDLGQVLFCHDTFCWSWRNPIPSVKIIFIFYLKYIWDWYFSYWCIFNYDCILNPLLHWFWLPYQKSCIPITNFCIPQVNVDLRFAWVDESQLWRKIVDTLHQFLDPNTTVYLRFAWCD